MIMITIIIIIVMVITECALSDSAYIIPPTSQVHWYMLMGQLHEGTILLLPPESFEVLLSCANYGICY